MKSKYTNKTVFKKLTLAAIISSAVLTTVSFAQKDNVAPKPNCPSGYDCPMIHKDGKMRNGKKMGFVTSSSSVLKVETLEEANKVANDIKESFEKNMNELKTKLKLTSAQESLWNNYESTIKAGLPTAELILQRPKSIEAGNTPEHQQEIIAQMQTHLQNMQNQAGAYKALYDSASTEQKEILKQNPQMMLASGPMKMSSGPHRIFKQSRDSNPSN